jgi:hypothetical protein
MTDRPQITLDWNIWCSNHLAPFKAEWPKQAMFAMLGLFNAAVRDERVIERIGGDANRINEVLLELSPVCCMLGDETMHLVVGYAKDDKVYNGEDGPMKPKERPDG